MYAIIENDGRQYKVEEGKELVVDYQALESGSRIQFDSVLLLSDEAGVKVGTPTIEGASVTAEVLGVAQGPKLVVQKLRRRKTFRRKTGHRQLHMKVRIDKIATQAASAGEATDTPPPTE